MIRIINYVLLGLLVAVLGLWYLGSSKTPEFEGIKTTEEKPE